MTAPSPRLPNELLDTVLERLFAVEGAERAAVCDALVAEHLLHGEAIRQVFAQLGGAERLLARQFPFESGDVPAAIGGYGVQRVLGEGAFGSVYLCTQAQPVARQVAVKVLRPGAGDLHTLRRFAAERQLLATLRHPAITHFYDAGHLPDGRPYFVMEYVDGEPITSYCSKRNLNTASRLRLFVQLCHGVEYAHGRGVVHRDLKPSNVLVVETTGEPLPKIIDFGIAKALAATDSAAEGPATEAGRVLGTPGYMSPEQAAGRAELIDERSDVFALGVMLYELLTGELPWPRGEGLGDATPQLASQRLLRQAHAAASAEGAAQRHQAAHVRGDLDWITRKATHAERAERYASVRALADDLERHIAGRPVLAGPPSITYRLAKLARRNRVATAAVAFAVLAAAGGLTLATWWGRTAEAGIKQAADEAKASFADAAAAVHKLLERAKDPELLRKPQSEGTRQALAADALAFYDQWLRTRPQDVALRGKRCEALLTLVDVHHALGQYDDALRVAEEAGSEAQSLVEARPASLIERSLLADARRKRYGALVWLKRYDDAHPFIEAAVRDYEHCAAQDRAQFGLPYGRALRDLGNSCSLLDRTAESAAAMVRAIATLEDLVACGITPVAARSELVWARYTRASALTKAGEFADAEKNLAAIEGELDGVTESRSRLTLGVLHQRGRLAIFRDDLAAALPLLQRAVATGEAWRQQEPQQALPTRMLHYCLQDLATVQDKLGDFDAAEQTMRRIIEVGEDRLASLPAGATFAAEQATALFLFARKLWNRVRRQDLALARTWLARAHALATETGDPPLWLIEGTQAMVAEADGDANDAQWDRLLHRLPARPDAEWTTHVAEAWLGVARSRFRRGQLEGAAVALANAEPFVDDPATHGRFDYNYASEIAWWRARLCLAAGDVSGAAPHLARMLELRGSWWGRWRAGDCEREAWRLLARHEPTAPDARTHRDAAADHYRAAIDSLCEKVVKDPTDPWPVVPWGFAHLGLAEIALDRGERVAALGLLDVALPALAAVEANAQCDTWDAARVAAARALHATLAAERPGR